MIRSAVRQAWRLASRRPRTAYHDELDFWRRHLAEHGRAADDRDRWEEVFPSGLLPYLDLVRDRHARTPRLLELGSGPVSLLAWGVDKGLFDLTAVDPLAGAYERLMRKHDCTYPVKPVEGFGENLSALFAPNTFDIAYSSNALDHTAAPRRCLEELTLVVGEGGLMYFEGFVREATNADWQGLHQHDLVPEDGQLVDYTRDGSRTVLTDALGLECVHQSLQTLADRSLASHGYEWDESSERDWRFDDWYTIVFVCGKGSSRSPP